MRRPAPDIKVVRHHTHQALKTAEAARARATGELDVETVDPEVLRHRYYTYLRSRETDALAETGGSGVNP